MFSSLWDLGLTQWITQSSEWIYGVLFIGMFKDLIVELDNSQYTTARCGPKEEVTWER
jgi:hypothetical protein